VGRWGDGEVREGASRPQDLPSEHQFKIQTLESKVSGSTGALREQIREWMQLCRESTLALFEGADHDTFTCQAHPGFSPIGWHLGHIAYTESLWLLEKNVGFSPQFPPSRRLFAADGLPKSERVHLPTFNEIRLYLNSIRTNVFEYLEVAPVEDQERLWRWLLQHESQHAETIALVLELQKAQKEAGVRMNSKFKIQNSKFSDFRLLTPDFSMVCIPAGYFECGHDSIDALDNERPVHQVYLETYWIDRYPVTCKQYQIFMEAGGYENSFWWSPEGWKWLQAAQVTQPRYWKADSSWNNHPVCGVSWYEADAYARFIGKRLPTEAEWEKAASWNPTASHRQPYPWGTKEPNSDLCNYGHSVGHTTPVDAHSAGQSAYGCDDMLGNAWEWTASWFHGYDGFTSYPYRGYSQVYFDGQHRVLRGGSWATRPWALRCAFRNWYHPYVREIFAGFRCAVSDGG